MDCEEAKQDSYFLSDNPSSITRESHSSNDEIEDKIAIGISLEKLKGELISALGKAFNESGPTTPLVSFCVTEAITPGLPQGSSLLPQNYLSSVLVHCQKMAQPP